MSIYLEIAINKKSRENILDFFLKQKKALFFFEI